MEQSDISLWLNLTLDIEDVKGLIRIDRNFRGERLTSLSLCKSCAH